MKNLCSDNYSIILIDGMNFGIRNFFGNKISSKGYPTGMLYGFAKLLYNLKKDFPESSICILWDGDQSKRKLIYPLYKANRNTRSNLKSNSNFKNSIIITKYLINYFGCNQYYQRDLEADDLVGYFLHKDIKALLISNDEDWFQYIISDNIDIIRHGMKIETCVDLTKKLGYPPSRHYLVKIFLGDKSDNISGIPRLKKKEILKLISKCESLESIKSACELDKDSVLSKIILGFFDSLLLKNEKLICYNSKWISFDSIKVLCGDYNRDKLIRLLLWYDIKSIANKL